MNTQKDELKSVKLKIKALASKTIEAGCSEHEAMAAMAMVGKLLSQYNLSMNEIDVRESKCITVSIPTGRGSRGPIDQCVISLVNLVHGIVWISTGYDTNWKKTKTYQFFVQEQDAEVIQYLYGVIDSAIKSETDKFKWSDEYQNAARRERMSVTNSFGLGMSSRISARLRIMRNELDAEIERAQEVLRENGNGDKFSPIPNPAGVTGTALIVLKGQLIKGEFDKVGPKLKNNYSRSTIKNWGAYSKGSAAGDKVNLRRPLGGNGKNAGYLS